jgi:glyoxylase-like metal-dependent hydrolase (beta-lactamase superfamily II)
MSKYGAFYDIGRWGFARENAEDHPAQPEQFHPAHLDDPEFRRLGYHTEELGDGVHWVTSPSGYDGAVIETGSGVVVVDAPPTLGENMIEAVKSITDAPVTHLIYSHWHSDHIGAASVFGPDVKIIAHDFTREQLTRFPDPQRPVPTDTFSTESTLEVGGVKLELSYKGADHCPGNIYVYAPRQKVLVKVDIISPGSVTFRHCDASENISGWLDAHDKILDYDFNALIGGHITRYGSRQDVETAREYFQDLLAFGHEAIFEMSGSVEDRFGFQAPMGPRHTLIGAENWINSLANYATEKTLTKVTSNGQTWPERLAGASVWTKYHAYTIVESSRLERTHEGYEKVGGKGDPYVY